MLEQDSDKSSSEQGSILDTDLQGCQDLGLDESSPTWVGHDQLVDQEDHRHVSVDRRAQTVSTDQEPIPKVSV